MDDEDTNNDHNGSFIKLLDGEIAYVLAYEEILNSSTGLLNT